MSLRVNEALNINKQKILVAILQVTDENSRIR